MPFSSWPLITPHSSSSDENAAVARSYSVSAMPTFIFLKSKTVVETLRGANPSQLTALVEKHATSGSGSGASFSGKGNTLSGGGSVSESSSGAGRGAGGGGAASGPLAWFQGLSRDNALPLIVLAGYLAYVVFNKSS